MKVVGRWTESARILTQQTCQVKLLLVECRLPVTHLQAEGSPAVFGSFQLKHGGRAPDRTKKVRALRVGRLTQSLVLMAVSDNSLAA